MYNCVIIDDEQPARFLVASFVEKIPVLKNIGEFKGPLSALELLQNKDVDILFLDIQMAELSGIDFLKGLHYSPKVIITSAYQEYAIEGYQLDVVDYLLKPFTFQRFLKAVDKAIQLIQFQKPTLIQSTEIIKNNNDAVIILISNHKIHRVPISTILYIESLGEYVSYFLKGGERLIVLNSLKKVEKELIIHQFIRIHRSYIVPIHLIQTLEGNKLKVGDLYLPIGRSYKEQLMKIAFNR